MPVRLENSWLKYLVKLCSHIILLKRITLAKKSIIIFLKIDCNVNTMLYFFVLGQYSLKIIGFINYIVTYSSYVLILKLTNKIQ